MRDVAPGLTIDSPLLPKQLSIRELDVDVRVERIRLRPTDLEDVAFSARLEDSRFEGAPLRARYAGVDFRGELDLSLAQERATAALRLATGRVDVGHLARSLGLASELDSHAERFALELRLKGGTTRELLNSAALDAVAVDGVWRVDNPLLREEIRFSRVRWRAQPGERVRFAFAGELRGTPLVGQTELPTLFNLARARLRVPGADPVRGGRSPAGPAAAAGASDPPRPGPGPLHADGGATRRPEPPPRRIAAALRSLRGRGGDRPAQRRLRRPLRPASARQQPDRDDAARADERQASRDGGPEGPSHPARRLSRRGLVSGSKAKKSLRPAAPASSCGFSRS